MPVYPGTGVLVGPTRSRPAPVSGVRFDLSALNPFLEALTSRWGEVMDIQTERLADQPARDRLAFESWLAKRRDEAKMRDLALDEARSERFFRPQKEARARHDASMAGYTADQAERTRLQASVDRARAQHATQGNAWGFDPRGAVADYYEYGAGNPAGRGGGGNAPGGAVSDTVDADLALENCLSNQLGPGCDGVLAARGYIRNPMTGYYEPPPPKRG